MIVVGLLFDRLVINNRYQCMIHSNFDCTSGSYVGASHCVIVRRHISGILVRPGFTVGFNTPSHLRGGVRHSCFPMIMLIFDMLVVMTSLIYLGRIFR